MGDIIDTAQTKTAGGALSPNARFPQSGGTTKKANINKIVPFWFLHKYLLIQGPLSVPLPLRVWICLSAALSAASFLLFASSLLILAVWSSSHFEYAWIITTIKPMIATASAVVLVNAF